MKRFDKQKEPAALIFSKAAGSKWARGYVCCTTAFFLLPSFGRFNHIFYLTFNSMIKTKCCRNLLIAFFFSKKTG